MHARMHEHQLRRQAAPRLHQAAPRMRACGCARARTHAHMHAHTHTCTHTCTLLHYAAQESLHAMNRSGEKRRLVGSQ
eukprot:12484130-Alexandrium_andersonii.AAC.1